MPLPGPLCACSRFARRDLLERPARVLADVRIGIVGDDGQKRFAVGIGDLAERRGRFLAQICLLVLDAIADRATARSIFILPRLRIAFSRTCQNSSASAAIS